LPRSLTVDQHEIYRTGGVSLSLVVLGVTARHVLSWILSDRLVSSSEYCIIMLLEKYASLISVTQVALLIAGAFYTLPFLGELTTDHREKYFEDGSCNPDVLYCDYDMVLFALVFLGFNWVFIAFAAASMIFIKCKGEDMDAMVELLKATSMAEHEQKRSKAAGALTRM